MYFLAWLPLTPFTFISNHSLQFSSPAFWWSSKAWFSHSAVQWQKEVSAITPVLRKTRKTFSALALFYCSMHNYVSYGNICYFTLPTWVYSINFKKIHLSPNFGRCFSLPLIRVYLTCLCTTAEGSNSITASNVTFDVEIYANMCY